MFSNTVFYVGNLTSSVMCMLGTPSCYLFSKRLYSLDSTKPHGHSCRPSAWSSEKTALWEDLTLSGLWPMLCVLDPLRKGPFISSHWCWSL